MKSVLIKDTTKEERKKIIHGALAISIIDCKEPLKEDMIFFQKYIDGEIEIAEIKKKLIKKYTHD